MAVDTKEKKTPKQDTGSVLEDPNVIVDQISKSEEFIKKYRNILLGGVVLIAGAIYGIIYLNDSSKENELEAQLEFYKAQFFYGLDSTNLALNGNGDFLGLYDIVDTYEGTKAANLAHFMIGTLEMEQGNFEEALEELKKFSADDLIVQGRAYVLMGDAHLELEETDKAIEFYKKASGYNPNPQFTPGYLSKLALAYELNGSLAEAIATYESIINDFPDAQKTELDEAKKFLERARALATQQ